MSVEGRQFPVDVFYTAEPVADYVEAAANACWEVHCAEPVSTGDILVFLPGREEIERCSRLLRARAQSNSNKTAIPDLLVLPLYAGLPDKMQMRVFAPAPRGTRKAVLATTIAETSVTVEGVAVVVDCCFARQRCVDAATGIDALVTAPVSQAAAAQRAGRAGRTRAGRCLRLCREADFWALPRAPVPELQRAPLAPLVLQLAALGVSAPAPTDFVSPPPPAALQRARTLLTALGALDPVSGRLTEPLGAQLALLPVDPQLARTLVAAAHNGCSEEVVQIAALMSVQHLFVGDATGDEHDDEHKKRNNYDDDDGIADGLQPSYSSSSSTAAGRKAAGDRARRRFAVYEGDHVTYLNVFNAYLAAGGSERWCREHGVRAAVMRKAVHVRRQLRAYCVRAGVPLVARRDPSDAQPLVRSIAAGFFANAAVRTPDGTYRPLQSAGSSDGGSSGTSGEIALFVHPDSVLCDVRPEWVVYTELVLTKRAYMRDVTAVTPQLLRDVAPHFFELRQSPEARAASEPSSTRLG